ncbi:calpain family cysteine protease protein [Apiospora hydei]|uniref:Calpain family cysteine protease protein n=1 Tax=Apiospora hydei TaxID=1337664 RepID=A0ABR1UTN3_9PEZI
MSIYAPSDAGYLRDDRDGTRTVMAEMPVVLSNLPRKTKQQTPQQAIDEFWTKFTTKAPGKEPICRPGRQALPHHGHGHHHPSVLRRGGRRLPGEGRQDRQGVPAREPAVPGPALRPRVRPEVGKRDTLESLWNSREERPSSSFKPKSVKRVIDIFEDPKFYIDGPTANDVRQGRDGDCWLLAALCTLSNKSSLIERVCVARDEMVGVYGFVFHRDGEWISEIIDDKLFLTKPDFDESFLERILWEDRERVNSEEQYRKAYQSGSGALYFAQCEHADETWLPLLEKAYAKAHGDYAAIEGGFTGEGIEDLTGGVTSEIYTTDILDREYFWNEELMKVNDQFLFGCSTGMWGIGWGERKGIVELHAYSVMRAVEIDGHRLVLLKNPWGKGEWKGAWSDGSKEWTADWLLKLNHRFGDDGAFWISYEDLLRKYQAFDRTRLFGSDWKVTAIWTTVSVPWTLDYHDTQFAFTLAKPGPVVIVLSQLDDRYYRGLEGQYRFELNFRVHKAGQEDYVVRSISPYCQKRSVNVELELEAGDYTVLMKINATRNMSILPIEEMVRSYARDRRDKLVAVGMSYDLAHSKGKVIETDEEKRARKEYERRKKEKEKREQKRKIMKGRERQYYFDVKEQMKRREQKAKAKAKMEAKKARHEEKIKAKKEAKAEAKRKAVSGEDSKQGELDDKVVAELKEKRVQIVSPKPDVEPEDPKAASSKDSESGTEAEAKTPTSGSDDASEASLTHDTPGHMHADEQPAAAAKSEDADAAAPTEADPQPATTETKSHQEPKAEPEATQQPATLATETEQEPKSDSGASTAVANETKAPESQKPVAQECADVCCASDTNKPSVAVEEDSDVEVTSSEESDESDISSVSDITDHELEIVMERKASMPSPPPVAPPPIPQPEPEDEFEKNPWNAVATIGLRVYYKVSEEDRDKEVVKLRVVRPNPYANSKYDGDKSEEAKEGNGNGDQTEKEGGGSDSEKSNDSDDDKSDDSDQEETPDDKKAQGLDVDDSSKDATLVGDSERRKKSIVPANDKTA